MIETTAKEFGKIDVLVNNAGAGWLTVITDPNIMESYEKVMKIDLRAVVYLVHLAIPYLEKTKGNIVNISSVGAIKPVICKQFSKQEIISVFPTINSLVNFSHTVWQRVL